MKTPKIHFVYVRMFVGIGTELLNEIQQVMREDREKAVKDAVSTQMSIVMSTILM